MYLLDDEGELSTVEVQAKFVNGKPDRIEAKYNMKSKYQWDRFMRFMERYSDEKGLGFTKTSVRSILDLCITSTLWVEAARLSGIGGRI